jgi:hypothetical protein
LLTGIVNCPSITVDGRLLDVPGYDPATGVLFDPLGVSLPSRRLRTAREPTLSQWSREWGQQRSEQ